MERGSRLPNSTGVLLAAVAWLMLAGCAGTSAVDSESSNPNRGVAFDEFFLDEFADLPVERLGSVHRAATMHCAIHVYGDIFDAGPHILEDEHLNGRVLAINPATCDALYRSPILADTPTPVGASTWDEVLQARFDRAVWWHDFERFESAALFYCRVAPYGEPGDKGTDLSTSAVIELMGILHFGDCDLAI